MAFTKLVPATIGVQAHTPKESEYVAFAIGPEHIPENFFEMNHDSIWWLDAGIRLFRAARALVHQNDLDRKRHSAWVENPECPRPTHADVSMQATFLYALAVENGLKAVIAAKRDIARTPVTKPGQLPEEFWKNGHDLEDLATRAGFTTTDPAELELLAAGRLITELLGRYHVMKSAKDTPITFAMNLFETFSGFERLFYRCHEEVARINHPRFGRGKTIDQYVEEARDRVASQCAIVL